MYLLNKDVKTLNERDLHGQIVMYTVDYTDQCNHTRIFQSYDNLYT